MVRDHEDDRQLPHRREVQAFVKARYRQPAPCSGRYGQRSAAVLPVLLGGHTPQGARM